MKYLLTDGGFYQVKYLYEIMVRPNIVCLDLPSFIKYHSYLSPDDEVLLVCHSCSDISYSDWESAVKFLNDLNIKFRFFSNIKFTGFDYIYYEDDLLSGSKYQITYDRKTGKITKSEKLQIDVLLEAVVKWKVPKEEISIEQIDHEIVYPLPLSCDIEFSKILKTEDFAEMLYGTTVVT